MKFAESYITNKSGKIKGVILDYKTFKRFEDLILDLGLAKAMEKIKDEDEVNIEEAIKIAGFEE